MRKNFNLYIFLILAVTIIITVLFVKFAIITSAIIIALSGWLSFLYKTLYNRWEAFYLFVQKIRFTFKNPDTTWNMVIKYDCDITEEKFNKLINYLLNNDLLKNPKLSNLITGDLEIRAHDGICIQLFYNSTSLEVQLIDLPVTYEKSLDRIENVFSPLFDNIESIINPNKRTYSLKVSFDEMNPYYGLYISKIPEHSIVNFDIRFVVKENKVEITKNSIIIMTQHLSILRNMSKEYLTLSVKKS